MIIKNLTAKNCTALGIVRRSDLDFEDDGNKFRGFDYKGMPITVLRSNEYNEVFLSIREDYTERPYTWNEWKEVGGWKLTDKFNGVAEIDTDDLIETIEAVIALREQLIESIKDKSIDYDRIENQLKTEVALAKETIEDFKNNFDWYNTGEYKLTRLLDYAKSLERSIEMTENTLNNLRTLKRTIVQRYIENLNQYGHIEFSSDSFYIKELREALESEK